MLLVDSIDWNSEFSDWVCYFSFDLECYFGSVQDQDFTIPIQAMSELIYGV